MLEKAISLGAPVVVSVHWLQTAVIQMLDAALSSIEVK